MGGTISFARAPANRAGSHCHEIRLDSLLESYSCRGRVAQLGEHLLCKHAFISPKSLNRRLFTVQNPLQLGLLIGLQKVRVFCDSMKHGGLDARENIRAVSLRAARGCPEQATLPLTTLRFTAEQPTTLELAGVGPDRRKSASCDETRCTMKWSRIPRI